MVNATAPAQLQLQAELQGIRIYGFRETKLLLPSAINVQEHTLSQLLMSTIVLGLSSQ
jgi:hypothetical protein